MRRIVTLLLSVFAVLLIAAIVIHRIISGSLPQLDGNITVDGLSADATIERDAVGIPTISAASRVDLSFATGFAHGQDRFFQMDLTRRSAAGELAELFGEAAVSVDEHNRLHRFRARSDEVLKRMTDEEDAILRAYTRGVNAGLDSLGSLPFEYHLLRVHPVPWRMADTNLVAYAMFMDLNDERATSDVRRGLAHNVLPNQVYKWIYPEGTEWDAPLMGAAREGPPIPGPDLLDLSGRSLPVAGNVRQFYPERELPGSNNWAVGGELTRTGGAIVANDMHLRIAVPNVWYRARLRVPGAIDLSGVTLPGAPLMVAGSNGKIAWGFTNSYGDWSDAVIVRAGPDENTYLTPDGPRLFDIHSETILVKGGDSRTLVVRETIWGPVADDDSYPATDVAVRWTAHDPGALNLNQLALEHASNVEDALAIANTIGMPPQNFVCGDATGNIGWTISGQIPRRTDVDSRLPIDGSLVTMLLGWVAPDEYPRIINPESGRIWTANSRVADGSALDIVGFGGYDLGARAQQIRNDLFAKDSFDPADMLAIQNDDRAIFLQRWRDLVLEVLDESGVQGNDRRKDYRYAVENWQSQASTDSVGYRLVRAFRLEVRARVFEMLMLPVRETYGPDVRLRISNQFEAPLWNLVTTRPAHLLAANYSSWQEFMLAVVDTQLDLIDQNYAGNLSERTWGERNTARIRHPISRALPILSGWLDMPSDQLSGDVNMPKAIGPTFGASERFAVSPGDEASAYLHMPGGQSGHPMSDFYRAGHEDWVQVRPSAFLPGEARHTLRLSAAH